MGIGTCDDLSGKGNSFCHQLVTDPAAGIREVEPGRYSKVPQLVLEIGSSRVICRDDMIEEDIQQGRSGNLT
jgi:hypothetical protein